MVCKGTVRRSVIAMKRDFRKLPANKLPRGRGGGESWKAWGGGGKSGKFYGETTRFPHTTTRGLNNDRSLFKVTKREGS